MASSNRLPLINHNPSLQSYFGSLESRIGYNLLLGGTWHFGYYSPATYSPFPIGKALRAMEERLFCALNLANNSKVLDAGCGVGHVALYMAGKGLRVEGIDVVDHHIQKTLRNIRAHNRANAITVRKMDYHHLDAFSDNSFDGVYTMETLVHATDPDLVLTEFHRILKPSSGRVAFHEYDHAKTSTIPEVVKERLGGTVIKYMTAFERLEPGVWEPMLHEPGFVDIEVKDMSTNIIPMLRLFYVLAFVPYLLIRLFGLQRWFLSTVAAVEESRGRQYWRYVEISARKPSPDEKSQAGSVEGKKVK